MEYLDRIAPVLDFLVLAWQEPMRFAQFQYALLRLSYLQINQLSFEFLDNAY